MADEYRKACINKLESLLIPKEKPVKLEQVKIEVKPEVQDSENDSSDSDFDEDGLFD